MMEFVRDEVKPDLFVWTGDNSAHDTWQNTSEQVIDYTTKITEIINDKFVDSEVTVLPIEGNHDTWPVNVEDFTKPNSNVQITAIRSAWSGWMTEEASTTFEQYGYYSQDITTLNGKQLPSGSRVIGINTQVCNPLNWWILGERENPANQIQWLTEQLQQIETDGGLAIILGHLPPNSC